MLDNQKIFDSNKTAHQFVEAAEKWRTFLHSIREWNKQSKAIYCQLKDDYMKKKKLHAINSGLDTVMEKSKWPR